MTQAMGVIRIDRLELFAHHGWHEEEQTLGQRFLVSLKLELDFTESAEKDSLEETVNYGEAARFAAAEFGRERCRLLETAASRLAEAFLARWKRIQRISVTVEKPSAPIPLSFQSVGVEVTLSRHTAYLGLGSNMGDRAGYLDFACRRLAMQHGIEPEAVSAYRETEPWGNVCQEKFINACVRVSTILSPHALLTAVLGIEQEAGRERKIHWGPRTLDIDILLYDDLVYADERLILPHPEMEKRRFVLEPLVEIAPWLRHPVSGRMLRDLLTE